MNEHWLDEVTWNGDGLVTVVTQEDTTGDVLMVAWMNREALQLTLTEG
ncbi:MAG: phosphoribosyl-AMP cyclohydrolase, partial [Methylotetracoccus sp.]|nr:phosphoribosyl-AMP cyclohydrolase [Methylotetracoccus sp.]